MVNTIPHSPAVAAILKKLSPNMTALLVPASGEPALNRFCWFDGASIYASQGPDAMVAGVEVTLADPTEILARLAAAFRGRFLTPTLVKVGDWFASLTEGEEDGSEVAVVTGQGPTGLLAALDVALKAQDYLHAVMVAPTATKPPSHAPPVTPEPAPAPKALAERFTLKLSYAESGVVFHEVPCTDDPDAAYAIAQEQADYAFCVVKWVIEDEAGDEIDSGTAENGCLP